MCDRIYGIGRCGGWIWLKKWPTLASLAVNKQDNKRMLFLSPLNCLYYNNYKCESYFHIFLLAVIPDTQKNSCTCNYQSCWCTGHSVHILLASFHIRLYLKCIFLIIIKLSYSFDRPKIRSSFLFCTENARFVCFMVNFVFERKMISEYRSNIRFQKITNFRHRKTENITLNTFIYKQNWIIA